MEPNANHRKKNPASCNDGPKCTWVLAGRCRYHHTPEEEQWAQLERSRREFPTPCQSKGSCKYLLAGSCKYLHLREEVEEAERQRGYYIPDNPLCTNGRSCIFLLRGTCNFQHSESDLQWAETQRAGGSPAGVNLISTTPESIPFMVKSATLGMKQFEIPHSNVSLAQIKELIAQKYRISKSEFELSIRNEILDSKLDLKFNQIGYKDITPFTITQVSTSGFA